MAQETFPQVRFASSYRVLRLSTFRCCKPAETAHESKRTDDRARWTSRPVLLEFEQLYHLYSVLRLDGGCTISRDAEQVGATKLETPLSLTAIR
jgi:hypothetical protein